MKYIVTHSRAPDPDPRRVEAVLESWADGLAEAVMQAVREERPIARVVLETGRPGRTRRGVNRR